MACQSADVPFSLFFELFFLFHCWCRYRSRMCFFSVIMICCKGIGDAISLKLDVVVATYL